MIATQFAGGIWFRNNSQSLVVYHSISDGLLIGIPILLVGLGALFARRLSVGWFRRGAWVASVVLVFVVIGGGLPLQRFHLSHWYVTSLPSNRPMGGTVQHPRIGVPPGILLHYPLYGTHLTNDVQFVGTSGPHGTHFDIRTCSAWRQAINAGRSDYVVSVEAVLPNGKILPSPTAWLRTEPSAKALFAESSLAGFERLSVFAIHGTMPASACASG